MFIARVGSRWKGFLGRDNCTGELKRGHIVTYLPNKMVSIL